MERKLSEGFTDKVIEKLRKVSRRKEFAPPFEHAIVNGIYCGRNKQGCVVRIIRLKSCMRFAELSYNKKPDREVKEAIKDLFYIAYDFGAVTSYAVNRTNEINWIGRVANDLDIAVGNTRAFAERIYLQASKQSPRLVYG